MAENECTEVVVKEPSALARLMLEIDEQWPILRFLGFGLYYAWIWLCYDSTALIAPVALTSSGSSSIFSMYLVSTAALSLTLILSAVFQRQSECIVAHRSVVCIMAVVASSATVGAGLTSGLGATSLPFIAFSLLTGIGTSMVALRLGAMYATLDARHAALCTASSFVVACAAYFIVVGLPHYLGLFVMALLPILAALSTMTTSEEMRMQVGRPIVAKRLPRGFFPRLVTSIAVFSIIVGVTRGFSTLTETPYALANGGAMVVFGTAIAAILIYVTVALLGNDFDISRLYYPVIIMLVLGITIMPLVANGVFESRFVGVAYACFTMIMWCLYSHVSNMSGLSPVRVFGLGRGVSAAGTTLGWLLGSRLIGGELQDPTVATGISVVMVIALLVTSMLIFNDRAIGEVLRQTGSEESPVKDGLSQEVTADPDGIAEPLRTPGPVAGEAAVTEKPGTEEHRPGLFTQRCQGIAQKYGLSTRERDVLFLLAKGRTINVIADELGVSFNTAKSHIRHVYVKTGVHTRQELLDMIEEAQVGA